MRKQSTLKSGSFGKVALASSPGAPGSLPALKTTRAWADGGLFRQSLTFILVGIISAFSCHALAIEWEPNRDVVQSLISLSETEIKSTFRELVAEHERANYAIIVSHHLVFELDEDKKAIAFLGVAQEALEDWPDDMQAIAVNMLCTVIEEKRNNHFGVIRYGETTLGLMRDDEAVTLDQIAPLLKSVGDAYYTIGAYRSTLRLAKELAEYAKEADDTFWEAEAYYYKAEANYSLGFYDGAEREAQKAYTLYLELNDLKGLGHAKTVIGKSYLARVRLHEAQEHLETAMSHYQELNHNRGLGNCYFNLGLVFDKSEKRQEAVDSLETASYHYAESGSAMGVGIAKMEIGRILGDLADYEQAEIRFDYAKRLLTKTDSIDRLARLAFFRASMYIKMGQKQKAIEAYKRALQLYLRVPDRWKIEEIKELLKTLEE